MSTRVRLKYYTIMINCSHVISYLYDENLALFVQRQYLFISQISLNTFDITQHYLCVCVCVCVDSFIMCCVVCQQVKQLAEQNICLKKNISCLFRTAKNELQCKNEQINLLHTR